MVFVYASICRIPYLRTLLKIENLINLRFFKAVPEPIKGTIVEIYFFYHQYDTKSEEIILYVDDTNIFIACNSLSEAFQVANQLLHNVNDYMISNLLRINMDKSCFIYFPPSKTYSVVRNNNNSQDMEKHPNFKIHNETDENYSMHDSNVVNLYIGNKNVKETSETRFLGVMFDPHLTWKPHIKHLCNRLKSSFAIIKRICSYIPPLDYKSIYHTLFESHLSYGISAWGNARKSSINQLFTIQNKLVRYLFGNYESFLEKHCTSARTRPYGKQILGSDFYQKEHTKPLFNENKLLTVHNLQKYMSTNEICKIITSKTPSSLYDSVNFSSRNKRNVIILPKRNLLHNHSTYAACSYWNTFIKKLDVPNPEDIVVAMFKNKLKNYLLSTQKDGDTNNWEEANLTL